MKNIYTFDYFLNEGFLDKNLIIYRIKKFFKKKENNSVHVYLYDENENYIKFLMNGNSYKIYYDNKLGYKIIINDNINNKNRKIIDNIDKEIIIELKNFILKHCHIIYTGDAMLADTDWSDELIDDEYIVDENDPDYNDDEE